MSKGKKFKAIEKNAKDSPVKNIEWEGEELGAVSDTKLEFDTGTGQAIILRFFDFGVNFEAFKQHRPTAQELFDSHRRGIESFLWRDGLKPYEAIEPRLMFSKNRKNYRFIISCIPRLGETLLDKTKTLGEIAKGI